MLARLPDGVMQQVVGLGVSRSTCEPTPVLYDQERHRAAALGEGPAWSGMALIWNFVVARTDGTQVRFHPQQTPRGAQVTWYQRDDGARLPEPLKKRPGGSNHKRMHEDDKHAAYHRDGGAASSQGAAPAAAPTRQIPE